MTGGPRYRTRRGICASASDGPGRARRRSPALDLASLARRGHWPRTTLFPLRLRQSGPACGCCRTRRTATPTRISSGETFIPVVGPARHIRGLARPGEQLLVSLKAKLSELQGVCVLCDGADDLVWSAFMNISLDLDGHLDARSHQPGQVLHHGVCDLGGVAAQPRGVDRHAAVESAGLRLDRWFDHGDSAFGDLLPGAAGFHAGRFLTLLAILGELLG